jgi:hypothetical protein
VDGQGNLYVEGTTADPSFPTTPGAFVSAVRSRDCSMGEQIDPPADIFVMKLASGSFQPVYAAILGAECGASGGPLQVDSAGRATFSTTTGQEFSLFDPYDAAPACFTAGGAVAQLSADGSTLLFSTYVPMCGVPPFAVYPQEAIFAGINVAPHTSVQEFLTTPRPRPPTRH